MNLLLKNSALWDSKSKVIKKLGINLDRKLEQDLLQTCKAKARHDNRQSCHKILLLTLS